MTTPPPTHLDSRRIGALALIAVGAVFVWRSLASLPLGTVSDPGAAAAPLLIAGALILCVLWTLLSERSASPDSLDVDASAPDRAALRHAALIAAATLLAALGLGYAGYRLTILALLLFFLAVVERKPIVTALLVSASVAFASHALFVHVLKVPLPTGPFGM